jgi:egghead protein (zeste-white 4 protein)
VSALPASVRQIVVPGSYATANGATHKARALHYAVETSYPPDAWVLHLDEESHITDDLVSGVRDAAVEEAWSGTHRVGQGMIVYSRHIETNRPMGRPGRE